MGQSIAVVEPQMQSLFHAPFNAALLHAIVLAFPGARVTFSALPQHATAVRTILAEHAPKIVDRLEWRKMEPSRGASVLERWRSNRKLIRQVLRAQERVVFCSISRMQLLQLKRLMRPSDIALAVLHGDLDRIATPSTERFPASIFALHSVLRMAQPQGLRFVLLGESIRQNIPSDFAVQFANAIVIDHPYHFRSLPNPVKTSDCDDARPVSFGVFGNSGDGRILEQVAQALKAVEPRTVFSLIGFVADADAAARLSPLIEHVGVEPISRAEFIRRAESVSYALWLAPAGSFALRPSGTFFDALAYLKPLVYVGNPFIDSYRVSDAGIGIRCATPADVAPALIRLISEHNQKQYRATQAKIQEFRARFAPEALATSLPSKFGW